MAIIKNAEIRNSGNVIRANVEVNAYIPVTGSLAKTVQWSGTLMPPNNTGLIKGEIYTLILPDHTPGKIEITDEANQFDGSVPFKGLGDIPKNKQS